MREATLVPAAPAAQWLRRVAAIGDLLVRHERVAGLVLLALLAWTAQFRNFQRLGLYEDDYWFIAQGMDRDLGYLVDRARVLVTWPQGRPLGFFVPDLLSFVGDKLGGLPGIYV